MTVYARIDNGVVVEIIAAVFTEDGAEIPISELTMYPAVRRYACGRDVNHAHSQPALGLRRPEILRARGLGFQFSMRQIRGLISVIFLTDDLSRIVTTRLLDISVQDVAEPYDN